jgi:hypothetical protein
MLPKLEAVMLNFHRATALSYAALLVSFPTGTLTVINA